ncbi:MFS-type transporter involved in bile tolerance, Atg22 family [Psychroflexus salarius]|uniref:MFS-type transporter involved in bile tolerance, Atg22 family n=1 Tax=Psychroflexus salarius TaxID=1155689 RepID=A0A1M4WAB3_9FLAO|nr:MFS transporter [Psychroflexus salarius]SHE78198.1 MFS-type transporter involved in bile tolerance, Atg22 family [Psychroflexus salarius]
MKVSHRFYEFLTEDSDSRICKSIPDSDCTNVPRNFSLNVLNGSLTKLAEAIISPNLTLAWILTFLNAPVFLIGSLVPAKDIGSLLPQLIVSGKIRQFKVRKYFWTTAAIIQSICMFLGGIVVFYYHDSTLASYSILALIFLFSIASGVGSVSFKDVVGKTIPKGERGQMLSYRSTFGGILALIAGLFISFFVKENASAEIYATLFISAGILWFLAAIVFYGISEEKGATKGGRSPINEIKEGLKFIKSDDNYRNFLFTRALLMAIPLLQPFYVVLANQLTGNSFASLGYLIVVTSIAQIISSPLWGKIADKSSLKLLQIASGIALIGIAYAIIIYLQNPSQISISFILPLFFVNAIAYAGARLSRKTYLVDYAPDKDRPTYVAMASTFIGLFTIITASFGLITDYFGLLYQFIFFAILLIVCIAFSLKLKDIQNEN